MSIEPQARKPTRRRFGQSAERSARQTIREGIASSLPNDARKLPWCKFYPRDWLGDISLHSVTYAARGLWADLLSIMAMCERRGYLIVSGQPLTEAKGIARLTSGSEREVKQLLKQLEAAGLFRRDSDGVIYSRRLVRDTEESERKRIAGRKGGNPSLLKREDNQPRRVAVHNVVKPIFQKPETRRKHTHNAQARAPLIDAPTLAEVEAEAATFGMCADEAARFWNHFQAEAWTDRNGKSLAERWRNKLRTWTPKSPYQPVGQRAPAQPSKRQRWQIQKEIEATRRRLEELKQERACWKDQLGVEHPEDKPSPEAQQKIQREKTRLEKLQAEFDAAD